MADKAYYQSQIERLKSEIENFQNQLKTINISASHKQHCKETIARCKNEIAELKAKMKNC